MPCLCTGAQAAGPIVAPDEAAKSGADAGKPGFVDRIYLDSPKAVQIKLKVGADLSAFRPLILIFVRCLCLRREVTSCYTMSNSPLHGPIRPSIILGRATNLVRAHDGEACWPMLIIYLDEDKTI